MAVVDPAELMTVAKALGVRADAVSAVRQTVGRLLAQSTWQGPAATRFRFGAEQFDRRLLEDADDLRRLMASYQRLADALEEELRELHRIEDQVRGWLALNPTVPPPWPPSALPRRGDPKWREVERVFVVAGVALDSVPLGAAAGYAGMAATTGRAGAGGVVGTGDWKSTLSDAEAWIIQHESNFDPTAVNPESGAFGIWQGLGSTLDSYAQRFGFERHTTNPWEQLTMFRAYIKDRYGTAEAAVEFWKKHNWY